MSNISRRLQADDSNGYGTSSSADFRSYSHAFMTSQALISPVDTQLLYVKPFHGTLESSGTREIMSREGNKPEDNACVDSKYRESSIAKSKHSYGKYGIGRGRHYTLNLTRINNGNEIQSVAPLYISGTSRTLLRLCSPRWHQ